MREHVFLIGFMGSGKTTVGRLLAHELDRSFVDIDSRVEESDGRTIAEIFDQDGESAFRERERAELVAVTTGSSAVVSCGGGIVEDGENIATMRAAGSVVYLVMGEDDVFQRLRDDGRRPLLAGDPEVVLDLLRRRVPMYEAAADVRIDTTGRRSREVVDDVLRVMGAA